MFTRIIVYFVFTFCFCIPSFSQERVARDADGNIWLMTDTIRNVMHYTTRKDLMCEKEELDSLIMRNQYDLWSNWDGCKESEPYASVVYSILFSNKMRIVEVRLLRREAYEKNPVIDNVIIQSIKKTKNIWKKCKHIKKNTVYVSRTRVVIPLH